MQYFGPDSREVIRKAMEQDKMNEKTLSQMDAALQKLGDFNASRRIALSSEAKVSFSNSFAYNRLVTRLDSKADWGQPCQEGLWI